MLNIPDIEKGETIIEEIKHGVNPSLRRCAFGYAIVLFNEILDRESEAQLVIAFPQALDALIDLDRIDFAMSLIIGMCEKYEVEMPLALMRHLVVAPAAKSFVIELESEFRYMVEDIGEALQNLCQ